MVTKFDAGVCRFVWNSKIDGARTARDDRRRATHNEVERRRRDKINNWIVKLSKLVPECAADQGKSQVRI